MKGHMRMLRVIVCLSILAGLNPGKPSREFVAAQIAFGRSANCVADADLTKDTLSLSAGYNEAQAAGERLRKSSKLSLTCRERVINTVMWAMNVPNLDIARSQSNNNLWREGAVLLGDLKASQALDLLLSHITMTDGEWSVTMIHQPALEGIIRMGPIALPKLSALLRDPDPKVRHASVYCIAWIGGGSARRTLQQALPKESDRCVRNFIQVSIATINVNSGGLKRDQGQWMRSFLCSD